MSRSQVQVLVAAHQTLAVRLGFFVTRQVFEFSHAPEALVYSGFCPIDYVFSVHNSWACSLYD